MRPTLALASSSPVLAMLPLWCAAMLAVEGCRGGTAGGPPASEQDSGPVSMGSDAGRGPGADAGTTATLDAGFDLGGVPLPALPLDFSTGVEVWWANHPFNPASPTYVPIGALASVGPVIDVQARYGNQLQAALDALPASGGTLFLAPGRYAAPQLMMKSNVHFISPGGAIVEGGEIQIAGCEVATRYQDFTNCIQGRDPACLACISTGRVDNLYFKNITFDGQTTAKFVAYLAAAKRVIFDGCTFQNVATATTGHDGTVSGGGGLENIWFRGCHFVGRSRWALYLDGLHFGGVVESRIDGSFGEYSSDGTVAGAGGGTVFMTNDDLTADYNQDGKFQPEEVLNGNHVVLANNLYSETGTPNAGGRIGLNMVAAFTATHVLVTGNHVFNNAYIFTSLQGKLDTLNLGLSMDYSDLVIADNVVDHVGLNMVLFDAYWHDQDVPVRGVSPNPNTMTIGQYVLRNNHTQTPAAQFNALLDVGNAQPHAPTGPNQVSGNFCDGVNCDNSVVVH